MGVHRCFMDDDGCFKTVIRGVVKGVLRVFYGCFKALKPVGNVFWYASHTLPPLDVFGTFSIFTQQ